MFNSMLEALYLDYNTELSASYVLFSLSRNAAALKNYPCVIVVLLMLI